MVTRVYFCKSCDYEFETVQPMNEALKKKCPECGKHTLVQDLSGGFHGYVKQYNSVGSIAEKNTRELGTYGREAKEAEIKAKDKAMLEERNAKLEAAGIKVKKPKDNPESLVNPLSDNMKRKVASGDKKAIKDYIMKGKE